MSGAEHSDVASAQCAGLNESVVCSDVHVEPSSGERDSVYSYSVLSVAKDGGSITDWDVVGESLNPIRTLGEGSSVLGNQVLVNEIAGMGIRISNCSTAQQSGDGVAPVTEQPPGHDGESRIGEPTKDDGTGTLNSGNVETLGTVGGQVHMDEGGSCYGPEDDGSLSSTCKNEEKPVETLSLENSENHTYVSVEGNQVSSCDVTMQAEEKSVSLMQTATEEEHALCHEIYTCEPSAVENSNRQEPVKSEIPDPNVVLCNTIEPELVSECLFAREDTIELPCQLNLQNGSTNCGVEFSSHVVPGPCGQKLSPNGRTGEQQHGLGDQSLHNQSLEENIGTQPQNNSTPQGNQVEDSFKNNHGSSSDVKTSNVVASCTFSETAANSSRVEQAPETLGEGNVGSVQSEQLEQREKAASEAALDNTNEKQNTESNLNVIGSASMDCAQRSLVEEVEKSHLGTIKHLPAADDPKDCLNEQTGPHMEEITEKPHVVVLATPATTANEKSRRGRRPGKTSAGSAGKKYALRSSVDSTRASRSRSQDNPDAPQPSTNLENSKGSTGKRRGRKKKTEMKGTSHDEFARMKKHLRYLLHRIRYEQNLLDAYSSEGWRGQSIEKLRPEKELQRAKADINRSKLKIRDLFQRLDSMSAEGKFPETLFDSEGLIDSEDIFCAKCGSKDLSPGNDIILCDGACDRGFHQYCLQPPLRTEEIPPGDEGWLCPACDCKTDCLDLLHDSQGTKLSIQDSWQKVFPEAATAMIGNELDDIAGLPSDDSEDNDYNPGGTDDDVKVKGSEPSSDDDDVKVKGSESDSDEFDSSDFSSASEDLGAVCGNEQYLGLPSDDSEDDDYDPDAANVNEDAEQETSSSNFTSASDDLGAAIDNDGTSGNLEPTLPLLDPDQDTGDSPLLSDRRHVKRLDYKKLYDETYGNATSDSSDDEEWTDTDATRKGKGSTQKGVLVSSNADASVSADDTSNVGTPRKRGRKKLNPQAANWSPAQLTKSTKKIGSTGKSMKRPPYNILGEAVTQRLYESFKENQYPDRQTKQRLAQELGLTPERVDKWFSNTRWSFNHHPTRMEASMVAAASHSNTAHESASADTRTAVLKNGTEDSSQLDIKETAKTTSTRKRGRKRKKSDDQPINQSLNTETTIEGTQTETLQTPEAQHGGVQRRRKKSGA